MESCFCWTRHPPITHSVQAAQRFQLKPGTRIEALQKTLCKYEVHRRSWEGESGPVGTGYTLSGDRLPFFIQMKQMQVLNSSGACICCLSQSGLAWSHHDCRCCGHCIYFCRCSRCRTLAHCFRYVFAKEWRRTQLHAREAQMQERNAQKNKRKQDAKEAENDRLKARGQRLKVSILYCTYWVKQICCYANHHSSDINDGFAVTLVRPFS